MIKSKSYSISGSVRLQKSLTGIFSLSGKAVSKKVSSANLSSSESKCIIEAFVFGAVLPFGWGKPLHDGRGRNKRDWTLPLCGRKAGGCEWAGLGDRGIPLADGAQRNPGVSLTDSIKEKGRWSNEKTKPCGSGTVECKGTSASGRTGGKEWTKQGGIFTFPDLRRTAPDKAL